MSNPIHALTLQLTGKPKLEECSLEEVLGLAQRYPYFAPAQFLLLQKLRQAGTPEEADTQYKKAVLFYPDPLQFEFFISSNNFYKETVEAPAVETPMPLTSEEESVEEISSTEDSKEIAASEETQSSFVAAQQPIADDEQEEKETVAEDDLKTIETGPPPAQEAKREMLSKNVQEDVPAVQIHTGRERSTHSDLAFEPYHTVDYFASQGIKIAQDEVPKDKLGKQLKSFTEWLKTMKRLPATQVAATVGNAAEDGIEKMADRSVSDSDVVTEAMAEVWVKQGAPEKALDIYNKLSLHNPSKRDYFAAKIESLKQF